MTLPNFLGIGVPKGGTSWLRELLIVHPQVYIPPSTKGIRFFSRYYDSGIDWYENFFPADTAATNYKALGEISAFYLYCEECPERIAADLNQPKLLLMLRHPVDRIWSNYKHTVRLGNYQGSFDRYLEEYPHVIQFGFYSTYIRHYWDYIDPDQMMIMLFDQIFSDITAARNNIAEFLDIDPLKFPEDAGHKVVNKGFVPRYRSVYSSVARIQRAARNRQIHWPGYIAKKIGVKQLISVQGKQPEPMSSESRQELLAIYDQEITELEKLLQTDLSGWRS